ncbi:MAG: GNAT family N-acetyltransferase [Armatimonadetes bacterium]|nr:GNAT family N-acetyltransferase [Armatimonadota bacterium]
MGAVNIHVAVADDSDVRDLARLHHEHLLFHVPFDPRYRPLPPRNYEGVYQELLRDPLAHVLLAREGGGAAVGFVSLRLHSEATRPSGPSWLPSRRRPPKATGSATLVDLYVAETHRRGGVGSALVGAAMAWFRSRGVADVNLGVMAHNDAGRAFWRRMGFAEYRILMRRLTSDEQA